MQSVSSRIWTRVAVSISYDDKHYTTGTKYVYIDNMFVLQNDGSAFGSERKPEQYWIENW